MNKEIPIIQSADPKGVGIELYRFHLCGKVRACKKQDHPPSVKGLFSLGYPWAGESEAHN